MSRRKLVLIAALTLSTALAGCGRALPGAQSGVEFEREMKSAMSNVKTVLPANKVNPTTKSTGKGVVVNGRIYPKGQEPKAAETPTLAEPAAGKGHLQLFIGLSKRVVHTHTLKLVLTSKAQATDFTVKHIPKDELIGTEVIRSLTDLAPGDYYVSLDAIGEDGTLITDTENFEVKVEAGKTAQFKI